MVAIIITGLICGTVLWITHRLETFFSARAELARLRAQHQEPEKTQELLSAPEPMPMDVANIALSESEPWAQAAVIKSMYDAYEKCRDWNRVRAAYAGHTRDQTVN